ncbi:hypothetical protein COCON_G00231670 [Conger conger]|uniref:Uncharacterized protein n=1 Tax=Conger conger TaxID=82655 RepID=A0A9Q1CVC8_CONCO|nr:hypothetical protein COCON_G00231670 [Conger conger]
MCSCSRLPSPAVPVLLRAGGRARRYTRVASGLEKVKRTLMAIDKNVWRLEPVQEAFEEGVGHLLRGLRQLAIFSRSREDQTYRKNRGRFPSLCSLRSLFYEKNCVFR